MVEPGDRKNITAYLQQAYEVSITRACKTIGLPKSVYYYNSVKDDSEVINKLNELVDKKPTRGFPYYFGRIRNEGFEWNHKKVKRVYNNLKLNKRRKLKRRLPARLKERLTIPLSMNNTWSMDFMHDSLISGRKVRILNIMDDHNRQALCVEPAFTHSGVSVANALTKLIEIHGKPMQIRCDNGPEFISVRLASFCSTEQIELKYIQPGKPTQNAFIERFNRSYREDILDAYWFDSLTELITLSNDFKEDYNINHPHKSLKRKSPINYLKLNHHI